MTKPNEDTQRRRDLSDSDNDKEAPPDEARDSPLPVAVDVFPSVASSHHSVTVHPKGMTTLQLLRIRSSSPTKARA